MTYDPGNEDRAGWAQTALDAFASATCMDTAGESDEEILHDLLCNLRHWCDEHDVDFDHVLKDSTGLYWIELVEDAR